MSRTQRTLRLTRDSAIPVITHRAGPGPVVVVTGNMHGDETTGLAACHQLDRWLPDRLRCGAVVLYPSLNPPGLRRQSRVFSDGVDLNRCFPGNGRGNASARVAGLLWQDLIAQRPDAVLDLHADSADAVPYALIDRGVRLGENRAEREAAAHRLAKATGLLVLWEYRDAEYLRYQMERSLAGALLNHGIASLTVEVGPRRMAAHGAVDLAVRAVLGVLAELGLAVGCEVRPWRGPVLRRAAAPSTHRSGVFVPDVAPGIAFQGGEQLGSVRAIDGEVLDRIFAPGPGCVVSWAECGWIAGRRAVGTLGLQEV